VLDEVCGRVDHAEDADEDLERRLGYIRDVEATTAARAQLTEMKRARGRMLLAVPAAS
jgi:hypothetical protein